MPGRKRRDRRGSPGLYRRWRRNSKTGKLELSGAFVIEINIPKRLRSEFAGINPRMKRSTEVYPGAKNAAGLVDEMKMMIDDIFFRRDAAILRRLQKNEITLATLYSKWKSGRTQAHRHARLVGSRPTDAGRLLYRATPPFGNETRRQTPLMFAR